MVAIEIEIESKDVKNTSNDIKKVEDDNTKNRIASEENETPTETRDEKEETTSSDLKKDNNVTTTTTTIAKSVDSPQSIVAAIEEDEIMENNNSLLVVEGESRDTTIAPVVVEEEHSFDKVVSQKLKIWQESMLQIIKNRASKLPLCSSTNAENGMNNDLLSSVLSNLNDEGIELDEEDYCNQVKTLADCVANEAVIPCDDDFNTSDRKDDDIDPEERRLEYSVRREIASAVISEKMLQGYTEEGIPCLKCGMPLMKFHSVIDCVVCPVLVKEIDRALKIRREIFLTQKVEEVKMSIKDSEEKKDKAMRQLEIIKEKKVMLTETSILLGAAATVAEEQAILASEKSKDVLKELDEAKKVSADAWDIVSEKTDAMKVAIKQSKYAIEEAMKTIEDARNTRHGMKLMNEDFICSAQNKVKVSQNELADAKEEEHQASMDAAAAEEALRAAILAKEAADAKYLRCQNIRKEKKTTLDTEQDKLIEVMTQADLSNKDANEKVQLTVIDSARVEKETTAKVEQAHDSKVEAEAYAKKCDDIKMHKEAKSLVAERLSQLAQESRDKALGDAQKQNTDLEKSDAEIKKAQDEIMEYKLDVEKKKEILRTRIAAVEKVRFELERSGIVKQSDSSSSSSFASSPMKQENTTIPSCADE